MLRKSRNRFYERTCSKKELERDDEEVIPLQARRMNLAEEALRGNPSWDGAGAPVLLTSAGPVTRAELQQAVLAVASGIKALGIGPGDKILLRMTNSVELVAALLGSIWVGAVPVLQNSQLGSSELEYILTLSQPAAVLYGSEPERDEPARQLAPAAARAVVTRTGLTPGHPALDMRAGELPPFQARADDVAFVVFTSGTTGKPKGVVHAHRWLAALGDSNNARLPPRPGDVVLATGEWSFISALGHNVLFPLRNGVAGSIMRERASPERILSAIAQDKVTLLYSVATLYRRILAMPGIEKRYDLSSLRGANSTGEPLEASVRNEWHSRIGCPIWEHYGVSEAQMVLGNGPGTPQREGSVGKSWGARAEILAPDLSALSTGEVGTLAFDTSYPGFFLEYLGDVEKTRAALRNGWFVTSDLARMDADGYVYILGRSDDCFKSKGVLIVPSELENAILALGAFAEACVFAIPDQEIGNRIGVAIVPRAGTPPALLERGGLSDALAGSIAPFKLPHLLAALDQLPKNANGKTQRSEVARRVLNRGMI
jgi:acyl-coenzyme A synthetase/AMP-(fatty) acid ligase